MYASGVRDIPTYTYVYVYEWMHVSTCIYTQLVLFGLVVLLCCLTLKLNIILCRCSWYWWGCSDVKAEKCTDVSWLMLLLLLDSCLSDALVTVLHCVLLNLFQNISSFILTYSCITHAHHQRKLSYFYSDRCFNIYIFVIMWISKALRHII